MAAPGNAVKASSENEQQQAQKEVSAQQFLGSTAAGGESNNAVGNTLQHPAGAVEFRTDLVLQCKCRPDSG